MKSVFLSEGDQLRDGTRFNFADELSELDSIDDDNSPHSTPMNGSSYKLSSYNSSSYDLVNLSFECLEQQLEQQQEQQQRQQDEYLLPTEIWVEIFLHAFPDRSTFQNFSLVCKYWKSITDSVLFWKKANKLWFGGPMRCYHKRSWKEFVLNSASNWSHFKMQEEFVQKLQLKRSVSVGDYAAWFWSCEKGHIEAVKRLLFGGKGHIFLNARDKRGRTALYHASRNGHHRIVRLLLSYPEIYNRDNNNNGGSKIQLEINCKLCDFTTPLLSACQHGHYKVVKLFLNQNVDVNETRNSGASPLYLAAQEGHFRVVKLLLKANAEVDTVRKAGATPLYIAAQNGHVKVVDLLIKASANVDKQRNSGTTPLHVACHEGNIEVVKQLLKSGANVNNPRDSGQTSLFIACYHGNLELIKVLLSYKANVNTVPSPLAVACQRGDYTIVEQLLLAGSDPNFIAHNVTPLVIACQYSMKKIVGILLKYNANPNTTRLTDNATPLSIACQLNLYSIVKKLIYAGADPNYAPSGELPLHHAIFSSSYKIVRFLLSPPKSVDSQKLIADVNSRCTSNNSKFVFNGETGLHIASRYGNLEMVKLLIKYGADYNLPRSNGDTSETIAKRMNNKEITSYLRSLRRQNRREKHPSLVGKFHRILSGL